MRFREIRRAIKENREQSSILLTTLSHLHEKAKKQALNSESDSPATFDMESLINLVRESGYSSFEYENFVDAYNNPETGSAIQNLVSNFNEDSITWNLGSSPGQGDKKDQVSDISKLAQQAVNL